MSSPAPAQTRKQLVDLIGKSVYHALGLLESLQKEHDALEVQDDLALNEAVQVKTVSVDALRALEEKRREICEASGFKNGPFQMEELVECCDEDSVIRNCWDHLMEIATRCNSMNQTNGYIIRIRQQHIASNLSVLRGSEIETGTYQRGGENLREMSQRSLAQA